MSQALQIIICLWVISTFIFGLSSIICIIQTFSESKFKFIIGRIAASNIFNIFGKVLLICLYSLICPVIACIEALLIAMTYHKGDKND